MMDATKYSVGYYPPPVEPGHVYEWPQKDHIEQAPAWCSVDLRDGNQSLIVPMSLEEKLEFYDMLVKIGFKEIEVGFPAASETEYEFLRTLIDGNRIPQDVTVQVLTQCRDHIIRKTFEAVKGAPRAIIHFYNSTSVAQREQVFKKSKEEIKKIAVDGAKLVKQLSEEYEGNFLFEYSPESFTGTEVDYAVDVCNAVLDIMQPTPDRPMIINLPVTVEMSITKYDLEKMEEGQKATVTLAGHTYEGTVTKLSRIAEKNDKGTPVVTAQVKIDNPDENIYLGLEAKVNVQGRFVKDVLVVPAECVNSGQDGDFCYVVNENGVVEKKVIEKGLASDDAVEVKSGLAAGDKVISGGLTTGITEGTRVTAVEE